jgi:sentrin-specific protease 8
MSKFHKNKRRSAIAVPSNPSAILRRSARIKIRVANCSKLAPEEAYLSYHDVRLTRGDTDSIRADWLTDNAISFWEEYLEHTVLVKFPKANIVLLRPSMSFMLAKTEDPLELKGVLPNFTKTTHIFLPINNATDPDVAEGGSHWSLLLASSIDGVAFHYDSLGSDNKMDAQVAAGKLQILLGKPLRYMQIVDTPQQDNGSDCGVFVCLIMQKLLVEKLLKADALAKVSMGLAGEKIDAKKGRRTMANIIEDLRKEGERRRSRSPSPFRPPGPPRVGTENEFV